MAFMWSANMYDGRSYGYFDFGFNQIDQYTSNGLYAAGEHVEVSGKFKYKNAATKSISIDLYDADDPSKNIRYAFNKSAKKNKEQDFSMSFNLPESMIAWTGDFYSKTLRVEFTVWTGELNDGVPTGNGTSTQSIACFTLLRNRFNFKLDNFDFTRVAEDGILYKPTVDGDYFMCTGLKLSTNENTRISDITVFNIHALSGDLSERVEGFVVGILSNVFTSSGYFEDAPRIFEDHKFDIGKSYIIVITIGSNYDEYRFELPMPRPFANMCFSHCKNGGVSFGGFPSSTDSEPKFESKFKGYFYNGFDEKTIKLIGNVLYPIGSVYVNAEEGYEYEPKYIFGGKWESISNRFLLASTSGSFDDDGGNVRFEPGEKGGTIGHKHLAPIGARSNNTASAITGKYGTQSGQTFSGGQAAFTTSNNTGTYNDLVVPYTSEADILPPYLVVRMWKRTELYNSENDT